jgi:hypothetical protein
MEENQTEAEFNADFKEAAKAVADVLTLPVPKRRGRPPHSKNKPKIVIDANIGNNNGANNKLSAMANSLITINLKKHKLTENDRERYSMIVTAIHDDLTTARNALFRVAENMGIIKRERLYFCGGYTSFSDFCKGEIGSRTQAYQILAALEVFQVLIEAGFEEHELPKTERLCRAIKRLPLDAQAKVWRIVQKHAVDSGDEPTSNDVRDAAEQLGLGGKPADNDNADDQDDSDPPGNPTASAAQRCLGKGMGRAR